MPETATVSAPETPSRFWVLYCVPTMSVDTAAASKLIPSGIGIALTAGTAMSSASPPSTSNPTHFHCRQSIR